MYALHACFQLVSQSSSSVVMHPPTTIIAMHRFQSASTHQSPGILAGVSSIGLFFWVYSTSFSSSIT